MKRNRIALCAAVCLTALLTTACGQSPENGINQTIQNALSHVNSESDETSVIDTEPGSEVPLEQDLIGDDGLIEQLSEADSRAWNSDDGYSLDGNDVTIESIETESDSEADTETEAETESAARREASLLVAYAPVENVIEASDETEDMAASSLIWEETEIDTESQLESVTESQPESETEVQPESETEVQSEAQSETDTEIHPESEAETTDTENLSESETEARITDLAERIAGETVADREKDGETWAIAYKNLETGEYSGYNDDVKMQSASVMMMYVMGAVYERMCCPADDPKYIEFGQSYSGELKDLLRDMIQNSSNTAAMTLVERLGGGDFDEGAKIVNEFCQEHGYTQTSIGRPFLVDEPKGDNFTSARDCTQFLTDVWEGNLLDADRSAKMLDILKGQTSDKKIASVLPDGYTAAGKTGEIGPGSMLGDIENDSRIVIPAGVTSPAEAAAGAASSSASAGNNSGEADADTASGGSGADGSSSGAYVLTVLSGNLRGENSGAAASIGEISAKVKEIN